MRVKGLILLSWRYKCNCSWSFSSSEESSDEQDSEDDITSSASCSGMSKSTLLSERGDMDSGSSTSAVTEAFTSLLDYIEASLMLQYNYK